MSDAEQSTSTHEPKQEELNAPINIKVLTQTGEEVFFKIKRNTKLSKLQAAYASKVGKDVNSIRFLYDGERVNEGDTPASLDMEDNDTIDVMVERAPIFLLMSLRLVVVLVANLSIFFYIILYRGRRISVMPFPCAHHALLWSPVGIPSSSVSLVFILPTTTIRNRQYLNQASSSRPSPLLFLSSFSSVYRCFLSCALSGTTLFYSSAFVLFSSRVSPSVGSVVAYIREQCNVPPSEASLYHLLPCALRWRDHQGYLLSIHRPLVVTTTVAGVSPVKSKEPLLRFKLDLGGGEFEIDSLEAVPPVPRVRRIEFRKLSRIFQPNEFCTLDLDENITLEEDGPVRWEEHGVGSHTGLWGEGTWYIREMEASLR